MAAFRELVLGGTAYADSLFGGNGNDRIAGNDGDDILNGGGGDDYVLGGRGADYMHGGNGNDVMFGGLDDDVLLGGSGADYLSGDGGSDQLVGGFGADTFAFNVGNGLLGIGFDKVQDFVIGQDKLSIINGSISQVTFVDEGSNLGVYYDGIKIAFLVGISSVPVDTSELFGDTIMA